MIPPERENRSERLNRSQKQLQEVGDTSNSPVITQEEDVTPGSMLSTVLTF